jgi:hypothetical protein
MGTSSGTTMSGTGVGLTGCTMVTAIMPESGTSARGR